MKLQALRLIIIIASFISTSTSLSADNNRSLEKCQEKYQEYLKINESDLNKRLVYWRSIEKECTGTGLYEYILGKLHIRSGDYDKALKIYKKALEFENIYHKEISLGIGDIFVDQKLYKKSAEIYRSVIAKYPKWWAGYSFLGTVQLELKEYKEGVKNLEKANSLMEHLKTYIDLVVGYYYLKDYLKAYEAFDRGFQFDQAIFSDRNAMLAASRSCTEIGKYEMAKKILVMLLHKRPEVEKDRGFYEARIYLKEKMIEAGELSQETN